MTSRLLAAVAGLLALALSVTFLPPAVVAQAPPALFTESPEDVVTRDPALVSGEPVVLRQRTAAARFDVLTGALAAGFAGDRSQAFTLNLFEDASYGVEYERFEQDAFGHRTWVGHLSGMPLSAVTLTWKDEVVSGSVSTTAALYRVDGSGGVVRIAQLDPGSFGEELPPLVPPDADRVLPSALMPLPPAAGEVVDIFVYYTAAARAGAGGQGPMDALIAQGVSESNTVYARSGVAATLRLVGTGELSGFVESTSSMSQDLQAFTSHATVSATRNAVQADLMHLVVASTTANVCGVAWLGPSATWAHGVTARSCFAQATFVHEVGHNFGNQHAPEDPVSASTFRPYSFGFKNCGAGTRFRTVMAYACSGATRILNLSNPNVTHAGMPTGTAMQNNARSQSEAFPIVQNFRAGAPPSIPGPPRNVQAVVSGNHIEVSWDPPASGSAVSTYIVRAGTAEGASNVFNGGVGLVTRVVSSIANGTYYIRVIAQNTAGAGPPSADIVAQVGVPPGPPQNVSASAAGSVLSLNWQAPVTGGPVSGYIVQAGTASGASNVFNAAVGAGTSVHGTVPPGTYFLRVRAHGQGGIGSPSAEATVTVACTPPSAPVLSGNRTGNRLSIQWNMPAGGPAGFTVLAGSTPGASNLYNAGVGLATSVGANVLPGVYHIRVVAHSACGASATSNEVMLTVP